MCSLLGRGRGRRKLAIAV
jgi:hypothetical protein